MPAINPKTTGNAKIDVSIFDIYRVLNWFNAMVINKYGELKRTLSLHRHSSITVGGGILYLDLTETDERKQVKYMGASGTVYIVPIYNPLET
jgi:hypothetical protein